MPGEWPEVNKFDFRGEGLCGLDPTEMSQKDASELSVRSVPPSSRCEIKSSAVWGLLFRPRLDPCHLVLSPQIIGPCNPMESKRDRIQRMPRTNKK